MRFTNRPHVSSTFQETRQDVSQGDDPHRIKVLTRDLEKYDLGM